MNLGLSVPDDVVGNAIDYTAVIWSSILTYAAVSPFRAYVDLEIITYTRI